MEFVKQAAKAVFAAAVAGLGSLAAILVGDVGLADVTAGQWVTVALAAMVAGGGVYQIPNTPANK
jgi:hypothetical protein